MGHSVDIRVGLDVLKSTFALEYFYNYHVRLNGDAVYERVGEGSRGPASTNPTPAFHAQVPTRAFNWLTTGLPQVTRRFETVEDHPSHRYSLSTYSQ